MPAARVQKLRRSFLLTLAGVVLLTVAGAAGFWLFWLRRPVGAGPVAIAVNRAAFTTPWTDRPVLLVGLGDSVTAGFGASKGHSYFERLLANPPDEFPELEGINLKAVLPGLRTTNLAVSGSTSLQHVKSQLPRLAVQATNVLGLVVLSTGGNDLIHHYGRMPPSEGAAYGATWEQAQPWLRNYADRLEHLVRRIREAFPGGCHMFLANIYDPTDGTGSLRWVGMPAWPDGRRLLAAYNQIIADNAARHGDVHLVDIHGPFLGHGLYCAQFWRTHYRREDPTYWYFANVEDPNDRGYDALRRLFLNAMVEVLAVSNVP